MQQKKQNPQDYYEDNNNKQGMTYPNNTTIPYDGKN